MCKGYCGGQQRRGEGGIWRRVPCQARWFVSRPIQLKVGKRSCQMAYKPGSVPLLPAAMTIHLERLLPAASGNLPGHDAGSHLNDFRRSYVPIWFCSGWGLPCPPCYQTGGALLPHHFTTYHESPWRYLFCGTFPKVTPAGRYPASCSWSPDFPLFSRRKNSSHPAI